MIKTKIVATLGPASRDIPTLTRLAKAGVDVFRLNFSHGTYSEHQQALDNVRAVSQRLNIPLGVMADLCGPKIRVGKMASEPVELVEGAELTIQREPILGTAERISTTLRELVDDVRPGQRISMNDGKLLLEVLRVQRGQEAVCRVLVGGPLSSGKGINLPDTDLSLSALTEKDLEDVAWIVQRDFDYVALSFVQRAQDVQQLRKRLQGARSDAQIVAKIEKPQALKNIDSIVEATDGILVARGDMGVELPLPEVPIAQKRLVRLCRQAGKPCIVATQMLESMIENPSPTRAEVSDVANAVLDGADAVMLSGETAVGKYPEKAVQMMNSIAERAESFLAEVAASANGSAPRLQWNLMGTECAIASAVDTLVEAQRVEAVVVFTATGQTAKMLSKRRLPVPILALTPSRRVMQQCCLFYGVEGHVSAAPKHTRDVLHVAAQRVRSMKWAKKGQEVVVVSGRPLGEPGHTNSLVVHKV